MQRYFVPLAAMALALGLPACGGHNAGAPSSGVAVLPGMPMEIEYVLPDALPKHTIGEELPSAGLGYKNDPTWGRVGGFTQTKKSQVLAFPPNTTITIRNLSGTTPHTFNVIGTVRKPPVHWPASPSFSFSARGNGKLTLSYASGTLNGGQSVKVKLVKAGIYLIGCAFHYATNQMRDVLIVKAGATPGPDFLR